MIHCQQQQCLPRVHRWCRWWLGIATGALLLVATVARADDGISKEYRIKAAYLYNFAKFVDWPEQSFTNAEAPLVIGVWGPNPFGHELEVIAENHKINGHSIVVKSVTSLADASSVHLLFFSGDNAQAVAELKQLPSASVLTVGESEKFTVAGGMIGFVREDDKVRFVINAAAAEQHGVKISAQLLKLARLQPH